LSSSVGRAIDELSDQAVDLFTATGSIALAAPILGAPDPITLPSSPISAFARS
jgi:hypothetical protein